MGNILSRPPSSICETIEVSSITPRYIVCYLSSTFKSVKQLWRVLAVPTTTSRKRQALDEPTASPPPPTKKIILARDKLPCPLAPAPPVAERGIQPRKCKAEDEVNSSLIPPTKKIAQERQLEHLRVSLPSLG